MMNISLTNLVVTCCDKCELVWMDCDGVESPGVSPHGHTELACHRPLQDAVGRRPHVEVDVRLGLAHQGSDRAKRLGQPNLTKLYSHYDQLFFFKYGAALTSAMGWKSLDASHVLTRRSPLPPEMRVPSSRTRRDPTPAPDC